MVSRALRLLVFAMIPIAGLGIVLRNEVAALLFGRGQMPEATVDATAATLGALLLGLAAHAMIAVLARAFYAQQDTRTPVAAALVAVALDSVLAVVLSGPLGLPGHRPRDRDRRVGRGVAAARDPPASARPALTVRPVAVLGIKALAATLVACAVVIALNGGLGLIGSDDPGLVALIVRIGIGSAVGFGDLRAPGARLAHPGTALYRRGHGRPAPPPAPSVSGPTGPVDPDDTAAWDAFVSGADPGSYLQLSPWAAVKAVNGWSAVRLAAQTAAATVRSAARSSSAGRGRCRGPSPTSRGARWPLAGRADGARRDRRGLRRGLPHAR